MGAYGGDRTRLQEQGERTKHARHSGNSYYSLVKFFSPLGWSNSGAGAQKGRISIFGNTQNPAGQCPEQLNLFCFEQEVRKYDP